MFQIASPVLTGSIQHIIHFLAHLLGWSGWESACQAEYHYAFFDSRFTSSNESEEEAIKRCLAKEEAEFLAKVSAEEAAYEAECFAPEYGPNDLPDEYLDRRERSLRLLFEPAGADEVEYLADEDHPDVEEDPEEKDFLPAQLVFDAE